MKGSFQPGTALAQIEISSVSIPPIRFPTGEDGAHFTRLGFEIEKHHTVDVVDHKTADQEHDQKVEPAQPLITDETENPAGDSIHGAARIVLGPEGKAAQHLKNEQGKEEGIGAESYRIMPQQVGSLLAGKGIKADKSPKVLPILPIERIGNAAPTGKVVAHQKTVDAEQQIDGKNNAEEIVDEAHVSHNVGMLGRGHKGVVDKVPGRCQNDDAEKVDLVDNPQRPFPDIEEAAGGAFELAFVLRNRSFRTGCHKHTS